MKNKITIIATMALAGLITASNTAIAGQGKVIPAGDYFFAYPQEVSEDYSFRTERLYQHIPEKSKEKSFWDFLPFVSTIQVGSEPEVVAEPELESVSFKLRVAELCNKLLGSAKESIAEEYVLTVSSFVNLNNLYQTSSFGRYIEEQMIGELQDAGVEVVEIRKTPGIMISEGRGVYGLSRNMEELSYVHSAQAMLVGTYTSANDQVLVNARLLRNLDGMVLSRATLAFRLDPLTRELLADEAMPPRPGSLVRVENFE